MIPFVFSILSMRPYYCQNFSIPNIPASSLLVEKEKDMMLAFFDVSIDNKDTCCLLTLVNRTKTFTGLLANFNSFTSFPYKVGLIRTLIDRACKLNSSLVKFHQDVKSLAYILKNQFPEHLVNKVVKTYLDISTVLPMLLYCLTAFALFISSCHIFFSILRDVK